MILQQSKNIISKLFIIFAGIIFPCLIIEFSLRIDEFFRKGVPLFKNPSSLWDDELGWRGKEHILSGAYDDRPVLVLGDSFTDGLGVPSNEMWFSYLNGIAEGQKIVAYGGMGYGTLQELLVLKKYLNSGMKPSLIVLQMCTNDIINNYYKLEKDSYLQRAPAPRPYLENGMIITRFPRNNNWLIFPLISYSRFAYKYNVRWEAMSERAVKEGRISTIEDKIKLQGFSLPEFHAAVSVTHQLLSNFKVLSANYNLLLVVVDDAIPYSKAIEASAQKLGINIVFPTRGNRIIPDSEKIDGAHFNTQGNKTFAEYLLAQLRSGNSK